MHVPLSVDHTQEVNRLTGHVSVLETSPHFILHIAPVVRATATALLFGFLIAGVNKEKHKLILKYLEPTMKRNSETNNNP